MALYFMCENEDNFAKSKEILIQEYKWRTKGNALWSPDSKDCVDYLADRSMIQVRIHPFHLHPINQDLPLNKEDVPEVFSKLLNILNPVGFLDCKGNKISLSDLIK